MTEAICRGCALAIAAAALLDPQIGLASRPRRHVAVVTSLPPGPGPEAREIRDRLAGDLRGELDVIDGPDPTAQALVVIGDRYPTGPIATEPHVFTVTIGSKAGAPRIASVRAPRAVPRGARIRVDVDLDATSVATSASVATVTARGDHPDVEVARVSHIWAAQGGRVSLAIDALPIDLPPWRLRVQLLNTGEASPATTSDVLVEAAPQKRVLFYDPRPSWIATFVRRALEEDAAFAISGLDYPSRNVPVSTGGVSSLDPGVLRSFDVVVVGGLDRLSVSDRDRIDWFARERGGSVVLLPDVRIGTGPARDWLPGFESKELLLERPSALAVASPLPAIQGSEILTLSRAAAPRAAAPGATVLAGVRNTGEPVVVLAPYGAGRLLVSGALDAWRYRAEDDAAFDRFWRAAIAGAALAVPSAIDVQLSPAVARPGERVRATARIHRSAAGISPEAVLRVTAQIDANQALRMWPEAEADVFSGSYVAGAAGLHKVSVSASTGDSTAAGAAFVAVDPDAQRAEPIRPSLAMFAESRGGADVAADRLTELEHQLRRIAAPPPIDATAHPMQSVLWMFPFAACLCTEWWLRRRRGER